MAQNKTEEIDLIVNHPKKAINKLALPIIISNLFMGLAMRMPSKPCLSLRKWTRPKVSRDVRT